MKKKTHRSIKYVRKRKGNNMHTFSTMVIFCNRLHHCHRRNSLCHRNICFDLNKRHRFGIWICRGHMQSWHNYFRPLLRDSLGNHRKHMTSRCIGVCCTWIDFSCIDPFRVALRLSVYRWYSLSPSNQAHQSCHHNHWMNNAHNFEWMNFLWMKRKYICFGWMDKILTWFRRTSTNAAHIYHWSIGTSNRDTLALYCQSCDSCPSNWLPYNSIRHLLRCNLCRHHIAMLNKYICRHCIWTSMVRNLYWNMIASHPIRQRSPTIKMDW